MVIFAFFIPIIGIAIVLLGFSEKVTLSEGITFLVVPWLTLIVCSFVFKKLIALDTEIWNGWVTQVEYYEAWYEKVSCQHRKPCVHKKECTHWETYIDSQGRQCKRQLHPYDTEHDYDLEHDCDLKYHPPEYNLYTSNDEMVKIDGNHYNQLARKFKDEVRHNIYRSKKYDPIADAHLKLPDTKYRYDSDTDQGDKYVSTWYPSHSEKEPTSIMHHYENKLKASNSIFKFSKIDKKSWAVYKYPKVYDYYKCSKILGANPADPKIDSASHRLHLKNANLGKQKQVNMMVLLWKNQPREIIQMQRAYWQGGKKNDFIVGIVTDEDHNIQWVDCISWTEVELLKLQVIDQIKQMKQLDLLKAVDIMSSHVEKQFIRKEFKDFQYLSVDMPLWAVLLIYILVSFLCVGIGHYIVHH
jgi:hypothetical protein